MALLVSACGFTEPRKFIVINEAHDIESSFLISALIGQRLRLQNSGLVLICCHQSFKYYDACGKKLGYNLSMSVSKKCLRVVEPLKDMINLKEDELIKHLMDEINNNLKLLEDDNKKNITIIIDDLSFFMSLGCSEKSLIKLGLKLHELSQKKDSLSFVLKVGLSDFHSYLSNNLEDLADVLLSVERLKSGKFWDVDGRITIKKMNMQSSIPLVESERSLLYFIGDHNVKLSAPGEFGLKV
ncbi:CLUMA_CG002585, isoform A [Clunio marinus]|uniref:Elongator complex protein 6 n=1 Tax=Clunio marinus TaxID=568069 RepID=A0A1J1HN44_9DIPT|nr:CLUMA_CG002585, isoform A [Clunio marinus]